MGQLPKLSTLSAFQDMSQLLQEESRFPDSTDKYIRFLPLYMVPEDIIM